MSEKNQQNEALGTQFLNSELGFLDYWHIFYGAKRHIIGVVLLSLLLAWFYLYLTKPVYEVDSILQLDEKSSSLGDIEKISSLLGATTSKINGEIELIRSRTILSYVVENLGLDIVVSSDEWRLVRRIKEKLGMYPPLQVKVNLLNTPQALLGTKLVVYMDSDKKFTLFTNEGQFLLNGVIGELVEKEGVTLKITSVNLKPGETFILTKVRMFDAIARLNQSLHVSEKTKDSGLLRISCKQTDPVLASNIINTITHYYVQQNITRHSEEASKSIAFLKKQLPFVRQGLTVAESALNKFRKENRSINIAEEGRSLLEQIVTVQQQISQAEVEYSTLIERYTPSHPTIKMLLAKTAKLKKGSKKLEKKMAARPKTEQKVLGLMRDERVKSDVYTFLLNKLQELRVVEAGTVGNVRIIDPAMIPSTPVSPKKKNILIAAIILGVFLGILFAFFKYLFRSVVTESEEIERTFGIAVSAEIPHSDIQEKLERKKAKWKNSTIKVDDENFLLNMQLKHEPTIEAMLSLRTNLHFLKPERNNIIAISGPSASLGKSFLSANMSSLLAGQNNLRVLLIDGDLRRGHLHEYFAFKERGLGLSDALNLEEHWRKCIRLTQIKGLDFLSTGTLPSRPANLLMTDQLKLILDEASLEYDIIWIDTPPVLVGTDAALIAAQAGLLLLLLRYGVNPMQEVKASIRHLQQAGIKVDSILLNDIKHQESRYGYYNAKYYKY